MGGSIIGPRLFWFFLGQCQKEQTLLPAMIDRSPSPYKSSCLHPIHYN
ncbi:MAG: hypothetical protein AVDCRST_MAG56-4395 [uncultured Cytophagales bacterium]|uniref:Uncharacterized protein n=1 Tax=uncultured Cytophagales bacterium TaxID=158755 RepID=A0A6J4JUP8_9SPHI|nr:MAG: hypothetical protein AVDCRST_MAG56-4395 [uncultured Cytophagales bacterium]